MLRSPPFTSVVFFSSSLLVSPPAVRSRGAVRLIRARVQRETRWAFVRSSLSYTNSRAQGQGRPARPHGSRMATAERDAEMKEIRSGIAFISAHRSHCTHFMLHTCLPHVFLDSVFMIYIQAMHAVLCLAGHQLCTVVCLLLYDFIWVRESLWVLLLYATIITGVVVETFPFVWTLPVSSRCHFAFHPHPLVRISAALLWVSVGEYRSLWVYGLQCHLCLQ